MDHAVPPPNIKTKIKTIYEKSRFLVIYSLWLQSSRAEELRAAARGEVALSTFPPPGGIFIWERRCRSAPKFPSLTLFRGSLPTEKVRKGSNGWT